MLENYASIPFTLKLNFMKIPVTLFDMTDEGMNEFNSVMQELEGLPLNHIIRTSSGGISIDRKNWNQFPCWDIVESRSMVEVTVITKRCYRFQFRKTLKKDNGEKTIGGNKAFKKFCEVCKKFDVDITKYAVDNGKEVKETIPSPRISITPCTENITWENVHHIDYHSAHLSGLAMKEPEFYKPVDYIYKLRECEGNKNLYKSVLTNTFGFMQSSYVGYKYANLSKKCLEWTNEVTDELAKRLEDSGRLVLLRNTDGIWYKGDIYHGEGEGDGVGQWSNDYHDCTFRAKSRGCYEFIGYKKNETERKYHAVMRGQCQLDKVKKREDWEWGDIYKTGYIFGYRFENNRVVKEIGYEEEDFT